jgi:hypothetical protein
MKKLSVLICCILPFTLPAQQPPATDIYLFDLKQRKGEVTLTNPKNITKHPGYDNQPFFHPDKPLLYYASADDSGRTDIIEYNYQTDSSRKLTATSEREYSPTVTPDKRFISCILQRDNGAQDLVKYPIAGGQPIVLISNLTVGYHAWADDEHLVAFILPQPFTLQWIDVKNQTEKVLAENIGRSLHKIPRQKAMSFTQQQPDKTWVIRKLSLATLTITDHAAIATEKEPLISWTPDGKILRSDDWKIYFLKTGNSSEWKQANIQSLLPLKGISRMAVSRSGKKIAVVVEEIKN